MNVKAVLRSGVLEYVRDGGNLLEQDHRPSDNRDPETTAPFPLELGSPSLSWRVTDENAPVTYLEPENPLLDASNSVTEADWACWVKDRSLYFPSEWDDAYTALLSMSDPGEKPLTSSLICYDQLDLVPGAFRMMVNLPTPPG